jgi:hypothetical protein
VEIEEIEVEGKISKCILATGETQENEVFHTL